MTERPKITMRADVETPESDANSDVEAVLQALKDFDLTKAPMKDDDIISEVVARDAAAKRKLTDSLVAKYGYEVVRDATQLYLIEMSGGDA